MPLSCPDYCPNPSHFDDEPMSHAMFHAFCVDTDTDTDAAGISGLTGGSSGPGALLLFLCCAVQNAAILAVAPFFAQRIANAAARDYRTPGWMFPPLIFFSATVFEHMSMPLSTGHFRWRIMSAVFTLICGVSLAMSSQPRTRRELCRTYISMAGAGVLPLVLRLAFGDIYANMWRLLHGPAVVIGQFVVGALPLIFFQSRISQLEDVWSVITWRHPTAPLLKLHSKSALAKLAWVAGCAVVQVMVVKVGWSWNGFWAALFSWFTAQICFMHLLDNIFEKWLKQRRQYDARSRCNVFEPVFLVTFCGMWYGLVQLSFAVFANDPGYFLHGAIVVWTGQLCAFVHCTAAALGNTHNAPTNRTFMAELFISLVVLAYHIGPMWIYHGHKLKGESPEEELSLFTDVLFYYIKGFILIALGIAWVIGTTILGLISISIVTRTKRQFRRNADMQARATRNMQQTRNRTTWQRSSVDLDPDPGTLPPACLAASPADHMK